MLVLTRKIGEKIVIDGRVTITVLDLGRGKIRLGIDAPRDMEILRSELIDPNGPRQPPLPR